MCEVPESRLYVIEVKDRRHWQRISLAPMSRPKAERIAKEIDLLGQVVRVVSERERPATPPGYEPYTPATVQAIRETCSTPASRTPKQET